MLRKQQFVFLSLVAALLLVGSLAADASAQCSPCASPGYYQVGYQPVAYRSYYTGWYPGYWIDRLRGAYRTSYYSPTYTVGYRAAYHTVSYPVATTAYYSPSCGSTCSTCSSCPTCSTCYSNPCSCSQQVTLRPTTCCSTCSTCGCDPCSCTTCSTCGTSYSSSTSCPTCVSSPAAPSTQRESSQPYLGEGENPPTTRTFDNQVPGTSGGSADSSNYDFSAPALFSPSSSPNDRVTQRAETPVRTAVYSKPVSATPIAYTTVDRAQAEADAAGWSAVD